MGMKTTDRWVSLDYLRILAVFMILYDHLGGLRNSGWIVKKAVDYFIAVPLNIIGNFGAFGVSVFFIISGFLFAWNGQYENLCQKKLRKMVVIYLSNIAAFLGFWAFQNLIWLFCDSYWRQFTVGQWLKSMTLAGYFVGEGDVINGTTWFLIPLGMFYLVEILYGMMYKKAGWRSLYLVEGMLAVLFLVFHVMDVQIADRLIFVYMPVSGIMIAELMKVKECDKKDFRTLVILFFVNYFQMVICFRRFYFKYYAEEKYLVSYMYALLLVSLCLLFDKMFQKKKWCTFLCKISLAVYLLQMTWGSYLMQVLSDCGVPFSIAFFITVVVVALLGWIHSAFIEDKILGSIKYRYVSKRR